MSIVTETDVVGMRVAVVSLDRKTFLGYGTYLGEFHSPFVADVIVNTLESVQGVVDPPIDAVEFQRIVAEVRSGDDPVTWNPRIKLDSGVELWGAECWWGDAKKFVEMGLHVRYGVYSDGCATRPE